MILCLKQKSSSKINSHRWVFNGLCRILNPEVVILIDAGSKPHKGSFLALWQSLYNEPNLGAAYGEVYAIQSHKNFLNPFVAAQVFEYKKASILDNPLESVFGHVSGGGFPAYRYRAIMGRPLEQYFNGDQTLSNRLGKKGLAEMSVFKKNMFFAGDRILSFEILAKRGSKWRLSFVKAAKCEVEVPKGFADFILHRRRWLNGAFAANLYTLIHFNRIYGSGHDLLQLLLFHLQIGYNCAHFILAWFSLGMSSLWQTLVS